MSLTPNCQCEAEHVIWMLAFILHSKKKRTDIPDSKFEGL